MPGVADVVARVSNAAFGQPLVTNVLRGHVAEAIVALALEPEWRWCAADYSAWDFERDDGLRLEVKQSARRQTWTVDPSAKVRPGFDVRERSGCWEGGIWVEEGGRAAQLYVFCYHERLDERTDHRDPTQWQFYVVAARSLPVIKRISIGSVQRLAASCEFDKLRHRVCAVASSECVGGNR